MHSKIQTAPNGTAIVKQKRREKNSYSHVKLPHIDLPSFSGKFQEWESFRNLFSSLIDSNDSLTGVQKLHYSKMVQLEKRI